MPLEIERKYLVNAHLWEPAGIGKAIKQGYLQEAPEKTVRVRVKGNQGFLTIKGKNQGIVRQEFEYEIPVEEAEALLKLCSSVIAKTRYEQQIGEHTWEIDVFEEANAPLLLAEIELKSENETFEKPTWLLTEVSADARYYNSNLAQRPYSEWAMEAS